VQHTPEKLADQSVLRLLLGVAVSGGLEQPGEELLLLGSRLDHWQVGTAPEEMRDERPERQGEPLQQWSGMADEALGVTLADPRWEGVAEDQGGEGRDREGARSAGEWDEVARDLNDEEESRGKERRPGEFAGQQRLPRPLLARCRADGPRQTGAARAVGEMGSGERARQSSKEEEEPGESRPDRERGY
jgi:hypothetical protein